MFAKEKTKRCMILYIYGFIMIALNTITYIYPIVSHVMILILLLKHLLGRAFLNLFLQKKELDITASRFHMKAKNGKYIVQPIDISINTSIYIQPEDMGSELYHDIKTFVEDYNHHRRHQGISHMVPCKIYLQEVA